MASGVIDICWIETPSDLAKDAPALLSGAETQRYAGTADSRRAARFALVRGVLRRLLAERLGCDPLEVALVEGRNGRPMLFGAAMPAFSVSHAGRLSVVALAADMAMIGIDAVQLRPWSELEDVARHFFTTRERRLIEILPEADRGAAASRTWARKEAVVKATGAGLSIDPRSFETAGPCVTIPALKAEQSTLWLSGFPLFDDICCVVATPHPVWRIAIARWDGDAPTGRAVPDRIAPD